MSVGNIDTLVRLMILTNNTFNNIIHTEIEKESKRQDCSKSSQNSAIILSS